MRQKHGVWSLRRSYLRGREVLRKGNHHHHSMPFLAFVTSSQLPGGQVVKNPPANAGDADSIPGSGRSPGGGNGNTL